MRTLDEYLKNYTTTPRVTQNLDLQEFWNLLRLRVFQSYNSGGNNSSSSSSNSTSSATVDTSSSVYLMYQPTPTGNDTSNNGTVVDNLVAWRNLSSVIDCFFLGEGDLDTTGMTPLLIL